MNSHFADVFHHRFRKTFGRLRLAIRGSPGASFVSGWFVLGCELDIMLILSIHFYTYIYTYISCFFIYLYIYIYLGIFLDIYIYIYIYLYYSFYLCTYEHICMCVWVLIGYYNDGYINGMSRMSLEWCYVDATHHGGVGWGGVMYVVVMYMLCFFNILLEVNDVIHGIYI